MPSSRPNHIPIIIGVLRQLAPASILELGVGFGKWGHLFREYLDIVHAELEPARYQRENWQVRIDGIEGFEPYLTPMHSFLYDEIHVGDMREKIHAVGQYDVVFLGDVIEHVERPAGVALLHDCLAHANQAVVITTPASEAPQDEVCGNPLEVHRSHWRPHDFGAIGRCVWRCDDNDTLIAVLLKNGVRPPSLSAPRRARRRTAGGGQTSLGRLRRVLGMTGK
jgi:hypothetical protein